MGRSRWLADRGKHGIYIRQHQEKTQRLAATELSYIKIAASTKDGGSNRASQQAKAVVQSTDSGAHTRIGSPSAAGDEL